jgi:hypothetical protein
MMNLFKTLKKVEEKDKNAIVLSAEEGSSYQTEIGRRSTLDFFIETRCLSHRTRHRVPKEQMKDLVRFLLKQLGGEI